MSKAQSKIIFDNIHGYIPLNRVESRVLETAYYQRLRWVRQLGFSFYVYPGATHTRHAHALGVLSVMDRILKNIGRAVSDDKLFNPSCQDKDTQFHRMMRLAALLHDIGTFPFSHTVELAYINHWRERTRSTKSKYTANHEVLGSHIILNTDFPGGLTRVLKEEGIDPKELSQVIAGKSQNLLANQLMHSDIDADRMDYLLRDAEHTGIKLGLYDMDFLMRSMRCVNHKGQDVFCIHEDAKNVVDAFLLSRYFWYSQIINDGASYKFDLIAAKIHQYFLENNMAYSFQELIENVSLDPNKYFSFNDSYFLAKLHEHLEGKVQHPMIYELCEMLAQRKPPAQIKIEPVQPTLIENLEHRKYVVEQVTKAAEWLKSEIENLDPLAWMIFDIPKKDVILTKNKESLYRENKKDSPLLTPGSVKILTRNNELKLLIDIPSSLTSILSQYRNFIPRIYVSPKTYEKLEAAGVLKKMQDMVKS